MTAVRYGLLAQERTGEPSPVPTGQSYDFCPTRIDVYGYSNVAFSGCGGGNPRPDDPDGLSEGAPGYANTLAGRLAGLLRADPELVARFGDQWTLRSCAIGGGTMETFADRDPPGETLSGTGSNRLLCRENQSPVALYSANNVFDQRHCGTSRIPCRDDKTGYVVHWVFRLDRFAATRSFQILFVSPQHEWHGEQGPPEVVGCLWRRAGWNILGGAAWQAMYPDDPRVITLDTMQEAFWRHHPCCKLLGGQDCGDDWFARGTGGDGWVHFGQPGCAALTYFWFERLRTWLLNNDFSCRKTNPAHPGNDPSLKEARK